MTIEKFRKTEGFQPPDLPVYDLVAGNGTFRIRKTVSYVSSVQVGKGRSGLKPHKQSLELLLPPIKWREFLTLLKFFRDISTRLHAESIILVYYNPEDGTYFFDPPEQTVMSVGIDYEGQPSPDGFYHVGDIHSHNDISAYHSDIDDEDEWKTEGLHIVVGHTQQIPDVCASVVVDRVRFHINTRTIINFPTAGRKPPKEWTERVKTRRLHETCDDRSGRQRRVGGTVLSTVSRLFS